MNIKKSEPKVTKYFAKKVDKKGKEYDYFFFSIEGSIWDEDSNEPKTYFKIESIQPVNGYFREEYVIKSCWKNFNMESDNYEKQFKTLHIYQS